MFEVNGIEFKMKPVQSKRGDNDYLIGVVGKKGSEIVSGSIIGVIDDLKRKFGVDGNIPPSTIFKAAQEIYPVAYGFEWSFASEEDNRKNNIFLSDDAKNKFLDQSDLHKKKIVMFTKDGKPIQGFENVFEALVFLREKENKKPDFRSIISLCRKHTKNEKIKMETKSETAFSYQWMFYEDIL